MSSPGGPPKAYWSETASQIGDRFGSGLNGLSKNVRDGRVAELQKLKPKAGSSPWPILLSQFKSPILLLLIGAAALSFFLKEAVDGSVILAIILASAALGFQHEYRASRAVSKLLELVQTQTSVVVDGAPAQVPSDQIVPGDVILLSAGSMLPGDALILDSTNLFVDQAALTGESFPVSKQPGAVAADAALTARTNVLYAGSHIVSGSAKAMVVAVGSHTELGSIAQTLRTQRPETEFEHGIRKFGILLIELTILLTLGVFMINIARQQPALDSFLFALALAVGLTPQLLPAIISVNLSRGAVEMAKARVIVKRLSSIENLGSMNVLCSDKTGTLTLGVVRLHLTCESSGVSSPKVLQYAQLNAGLQSGFKNPIDDALIASATAGFSNGVKSLGELPYDFIRKRLSVAINDGSEKLLITKGALKTVLDVCDTAAFADGIKPVTDVRDQLEKLYQQFSDQGYRVLGVATRKLEDVSGPLQPDVEAHMEFEGFIVLEDPLRPEIAQTVARLQSQGVELKVITGDNRLVAARLGKELGLSNSDVLTGSDLHTITDRALFQQVATKQIFAEIEPNQKERIVTALKKRGYVVGYIGDGINDGAALHAADAGISVANAVDVAKEAADFVMLEPGLDVLINAVQEGRRTFANTMKYIFMATSANFGNMFSLAGASLLINFLPLLPKQVLLMNFITDIPEVTIASDSVDAEQMNVPQRWDIHLLRKFMIVFGILSSAFDYATFALLLGLHVDAASTVPNAPHPMFQTGWFVESVVSASLIVLVIRSRRPFLKSRPSPALLWSTLAIIAITLALPFSPLATVFGFVPPKPIIMVAIAGIIIVYVASAEIAKRIFWKSVSAPKKNAAPLPLET